MPPCEVASRTIFCFQFGIFEKWPSPHKNLVRGSSHQILVRKSATRQWNGFEQGFLRLKCPVFVFFRFFFALSKMHMGSSGRQSACVPDSVLAHVSRAHQYWLGPWTPRCRTQGGLCGSRRPDDPMPILMIENRNPFPFSRIIGIGSHTKIPCYGIRNTKTWSDQRVCEQSPRLWPKKQKFVTLSLTATTVTFWPQTSRSPSHHFGCRSKCVLLWFTKPGMPQQVCATLMCCYGPRVSSQPSQGGTQKGRITNISSHPVLHQTTWGGQIPTLQWPCPGDAENAYELWPGFFHGLLPVSRLTGRMARFPLGQCCEAGTLTNKPSAASFQEDEIWIAMGMQNTI